MHRDDRRNRVAAAVDSGVERERAAGNVTTCETEHEAAQRDAEARAERELTFGHRDVSRVCVGESIRCRRARTRNGFITTGVEPVSVRRVPGSCAAGADGGPVHVPEDVGGARFRWRGNAEESRGDHQGRTGENSTRMTPGWHKRNSGEDRGGTTSYHRRFP